MNKTSRRIPTAGLLPPAAIFIMDWIYKTTTDAIGKYSLDKMQLHLYNTERLQARVTGWTLASFLAEKYWWDAFAHMGRFVENG